MKSTIVSVALGTMLAGTAQAQGVETAAAPEEDDAGSLETAKRDQAFPSLVEQIEKDFTGVRSSFAEEQRGETVEERNSQPGADPWSVDSGAALFSRPSFSERLKLSAEADGQFAATVNSSMLFEDPNRWMSGLQFIGGWHQAEAVVSLGAKWNLSLSDARFLSKKETRAIAESNDQFLQTCIARSASETPLLECAPKANEHLQGAIDEAVIGKPKFSVGASASFDYESKERDAVKANIAAEVGGRYWTLIANADFVHERAEETDALDEYTNRIGGGLAVSARVPGYTRFSATLGGKVLQCVGACEGEDTLLQFGPEVGVEIVEDTLVGVSLQWTDDNLRDERFLLSFSRSIGKLE